MSVSEARDSAEEYTIAWIAALPLERAAAEILLDEHHDKPAQFRKNSSDQNSYTWGRVHKHNVVIASLPAGEYGTTSAADTASGLRASLPHIKIGLLVGIGAGVPQIGEPDDQILLGDVVVSNPDGTNGGVVQHDLLKLKTVDSSTVAELKGFLNAPPRAIRSALAHLQAKHEYQDSKIPQYLEAFGRSKKSKKAYGFPAISRDPLRVALQTQGLEECRIEPEVHYGTIASGNKLIKSGAERDAIMAWFRTQNINPICFEMEAAGLMNSFPCLVIRGICDYGDENKDDEWQRYAAATAAAFAKEFMGYLDEDEMQISNPLSKILGSIDDQVRAIAADTSLLQRGHASKELQVILDWLADDNQYVTFRAHKGRCMPGSGTWFLGHGSFRKWLAGESDDHVLYCPGVPGAGKTFMATVILSHIFARREQSGGVLFYYFDHAKQSEQTFERFLSTLLRHAAARERAPEHSLKDLYQKHRSSPTRPEAEVLEKLLCRMLEKSLETVLVIDALDECDPAVRTEVLSFIDRHHSGGHISILVTSRDDPEVHSALGSFDRIEMKASHDDTAAYVRTSVSKVHLYVEISEELLQTITSRILENTDGVFLLVRLHVDNMLSKTSIRDIKAALDTLPNDRDGAYTATMHRILSQPSERSQLACLTLAWVSHMDEKLSVTELQHALALRPGDVVFDRDGMSRKELLLSVCAGLLQIQSGLKDEYVRFSHFTTKEYFIATRDRWFPSARLNLTRTCLAYVSLPEIRAQIASMTEEGRRKISRFRWADPMDEWFEWAAEGYSGLFRHKQTGARFDSRGFSKPYDGVYRCGLPERLTRRTTEHTKVCSKLSLDADTMAYWLPIATWGTVHGHDWTISLRTFPLYHCATTWGIFASTIDKSCNHVDLNELASFILQAAPRSSSVPWHVPSSRLIGRHGLIYYAKTIWHNLAYWDLVEVSRTILEAYKVSYSDAVDDAGNSPLHYAAWNGSNKMISWLLAKGADPNARDWAGATPLVRAILGGHESTVASLLAHEGIDPHICCSFEMDSDRHERHPVYWAAYAGRSTIINLLAQRGGINLSPNDSRTHGTLSIAIESGINLAAFRTLLKLPGVSVNTPNSCGVTLLMMAMKPAYGDFLEELLDTPGIDLNAGEPTPLSIAIVSGRTENAKRFLRSAHVDVNAGMHSPLFYAAYMGARATVQELLCHEKIDVNAGQHSPLSCAAGRGREDIVRDLLHAKGINPAAGDLNPLLCAISRGHEEIVNMLLASQGIDLGAEGLLAHAVKEGNLKIVQSLLQVGGIDLISSDPLQIAIRKGDDGLVSELLRHAGIDANASEKSPLLWALRKGKLDLARTLLATPSVKVNHGQTLIRATKEGQVKIAEEFLGTGDIDVNAGSALVVAIETGDRKMLESLLSCEGSDVNADSPLVAAIEQGDNELVEALLTCQGVDVNAGTPLVVATAKGSAEIVKTLLRCDSIDVNAGGPILTAISNRDTGIVRDLLAHKDIQVNRGMPLAVATDCRSLEIVKLLLAHEDVSVNTGSPLLAAIENSHDEIAEELLACEGIQVNRGNPLASAIKQGKLNIVQALLKCESLDVNHGYPGPLFYAVRQGDRDIVQALVAVPDLKIGRDELCNVVFEAWGKPTNLIPILSPVLVRYTGNTNDLDSAMVQAMQYIIECMIEKHTRKQSLWEAMLNLVESQPSLLAENLMELVARCSPGNIDKKHSDTVLESLRNKPPKPSGPYPAEIFTALMYNDGSDVRCQRCVEIYINTGFHCWLCSRRCGTYDLCAECVRAGKWCLDENHVLQEYQETARSWNLQTKWRTIDDIPAMNTWRQYTSVRPAGLAVSESTRK